jgi:flagellar basal-body rod modification protein FlgD
MSAISNSNSIQSASVLPDPAGPTVASPINDSLNRNAFLQLLVAQLKNQSPLNPADGTQFVAQLAQFSQLEQTISMREELEAIHKAIAAPVTANPTAPQPPA